ncbi:Uncharacterised protein [Serratia fonticola]|uniref:Uncharacterized protein n=1 Tax=Serratia fonticola TaxID=47917 RepID=A0A4U9TB89_SERFO|nr:Uncharacterised protein [Serratia fonticola]
MKANNIRLALLIGGLLSIAPAAGGEPDQSGRCRNDEVCLC